MIKNKDQFNIYGHASGGWQITSLEDWQHQPLTENQALMSRFKALKSDKPVLIDANDVLLVGDPLINPDRSLLEVIKTGHLEVLNFDKKRNFELKYRGKQPLLPASYQDQAKLRAAFSLLKDYYAPEKAPLPHFLQLNALRRLLTFHTGRRYCKQAEELYKSLGTTPLDHTHDFLRVAKDLEKELRVIRGFSHDKNNTNSIFNSSYTRRLEYILQTLKKTDAYEQASQQLEADTYLGIFDIKYGHLR